MATDNSPVVTEEKLLYFYNTYLKPYINAESGGHAIKNENDLLPLEQRETMVLNTPLMGSDDSTNEATVLDVDTNVDLSVIHAPGTRTPDEFEVAITNPQEGQVMRYNATSEQWENGDDFHVYSSDERVVGKWIDGKPIYEKTISTTVNYTAVRMTDFDILSVPVDTIVSIDGFYDNVYQIPIINTSSGAITFNVRINKETNGFKLWILDGTTGIKVITATLRYTKTTDTV